MKLHQFTFKTKYFIRLSHTLHVQIMYLGTANNYFHVNISDQFKKQYVKARDSGGRQQGLLRLESAHLHDSTLPPRNCFPFHLIEITWFSIIRISDRMRHC